MHRLNFNNAHWQLPHGASRVPSEYGDGNAWYRTRQYSEGFEDYGEYLDLLTRIFTEVYRVTKPGGICAIVTGTVLLDGRYIPVPFDRTARLHTVGWEFHQDIIGHKTTAGVKRAGSAIQKPYPGYYYPNIMTEYILLFRKLGEKIYRQVNGNREASRFEDDDPPVVTLSFAVSSRDPLHEGNIGCPAAVRCKISVATASLAARR